MNAQILCEAYDSAIESLNDYAPKYVIDLFPQVIHSERYDKLEDYYLTHYRTQLHQDTLTFFLTLIAYHEAILFIEKNGEQMIYDTEPLALETLHNLLKEAIGHATTSIQLYLMVQAKGFYVREVMEE